MEEQQENPVYNCPNNPPERRDPIKQVFTDEFGNVTEIIIDLEPEEY